MKTYPSIFNDVIGPVMRGPSSSHCAAALRIGRICRDLMNNNIEDVYIEFDPNGSLATTHSGQGSDMGLFGGLLGWNADDERLKDYEMYIKKAGIKIKIDIHPIDAKHPNTYKITLKNKLETHQVIGLSTGGGMIEIIEIDQSPVSFMGDFNLTLIIGDSALDFLESITKMGYGEVSIHSGSSYFILVRSNEKEQRQLLEQIKALEMPLTIRTIDPVLPIKSRKNLSVPFITVAQLMEYNKDKNLNLWELALEYESQRGNIPKEEVLDKMGSIVDIMENSINLGLKGTHYKDRILGSQSLNFKKNKEEKKLIPGDVLNNAIMFTSSMMEVKSSMGVIVAAPTAGSCGALPGTIIGTAVTLGFSREQMVQAILAAGLIGVFITAHATFSAEVGGCMGECGSASGMAAAGVVVLKDGSLSQSLAAASMALQSSLGLICDTVADRVEAPCLNRNVMAASTAISCANMALSDYDQVIPLDEVIETMKRVGDAIPHTLRCTGLGGLAITRTAKKIEAALHNNRSVSYKSC
ncbi:MULTISPECIES: L-serine ammonia-lyase, iron-sulfur-dependent, subunit alpha [unclassified Arenibacter]|uniref:L-serine ammonia-lyase, iron-sulfur-dependent, subunit alpha n=1 Tax=unclassified Arenibacter TaxID=2615047 RepID=UPI000E34D4DC|nr:MULTISPECIES: L-serine ammonia-lyase, iron-sulfur-dependent, subunit alpha [unclassified Arenibacter]MCM4164713.1 serine dehydratase [Arenibacter sp. A80]RFT55877.1 serine dehydratase [Arenibacter sp. P308M17]